LDLLVLILGYINGVELDSASIRINHESGHAASYSKGLSIRFNNKATPIPTHCYSRS